MDGIHFFPCTTMTIPSENPAPEHWLAVVREKVAAIRFGSVQITVHEGRVTLVEAVEKMRIDPDGTPLPAPGNRGRKPL